MQIHSADFYTKSALKNAQTSADSIWTCCSSSLETWPAFMIWC